MFPTAQRKKFYSAHLSRDFRFDGKFFVAVRTTNIYCRPICPARKAKLENLDFFLHAAEAEENGYRPCRRCRPETAPGSPAWLGTSTTVQRAIRIMDSQATNGLTVPRLAGAVGVGERWLRELFQQQVGVSPQKILVNKKLDVSRNLLDATSLSITEIAYQSGFNSLRRFNEAFKERYRLSPRELRRNKSQNGRTIVELAFRPPYNWNEVLGFFGHRMIAGIELVEDNAYFRSVELSGNRGWIEIRLAKENKFTVEFEFDGRVNLVEFVSRVRNMLDLDADPIAIGSVLKKDKAIKPLIGNFSSLRVPGCWSGFEIAVRAIIGQQISVKGANTLLGRLVAKLGETHRFEKKVGFHFPLPSSIAEGDLTGIGLTTSRIRTLKGLSSRVAEKQIILDGTADHEETLKSLLDLPGIGPWTAQYISMRALRNPNAYPESDLELRKQVDLLGANPERWEPWRAYGAITLWKNSSKKEGRK